MEKSGSDYLIIDLRYNGGGSTPLVPPLLYVLYGNKYLNFDFEAEWIRRISPLYLQKIGMTSIEEYSRTYMDRKISEEYLFQTFGNYGAYIFGNYSGDMTLEQKIESEIAFEVSCFNLLKAIAPPKPLYGSGWVSNNFLTK